MSMLTTSISYPKTKWGTLFLSLLLTIFLPVVFWIIYHPPWLLFDTFQCSYIDTIGQCGYSEAFLNFLVLYFGFGLMVSLGTIIIIPTLLMWALFDYFRRQSVEKF